MLVCSQVEEINNYLARLFFNLEAFSMSFLVIKLKSIMERLGSGMTTMVVGGGEPILSDLVEYITFVFFM
jgi:hypothetical protein